MSGLKRIILSITFILTVFFCGFFAPEAQAENHEDENNEKYSLVIYDLCGEALTPVEGAEFTVSKVANLTEGGEYELRDMYEPSGVTSDDINNMERASDINDVMERLMDAEISDPDAFSEKTDKNGKLEITGLTKGLYLVTAKTLEKDDEIYESTPFLIAVPGEETGSNQYQVTVYAKTSVLDSSIVGTTDDKTDETDETDGTDESESESQETKSSGIIQTVTSMLTGDNAPILLLSIIVIAAFIVVVIQLIFIIKRKKKDSRP